MDAKNREVLERALEDVWNLGKEEMIERYYHRDYVGHFSPPESLIGHEGVRRGLLEIREAFPDFYEECHDLIGEGDKIVARITLSGTQRAPFLGNPSSGKRFEIATLDIYRFLDNKIIEQWGVMDVMTMASQLGWPAR